MLTTIKDLDYKLLNKLEDRDLVSYCQISVKANEICKDRQFWLNRILTKFPYIPLDILKEYKGDRTWSDYYIYDLRKFMNMHQGDWTGSLGGSIFNNRKDYILIALNNGADINVKTPLTEANGLSYTSTLDTKKFLLDRGINVNFQNKYGTTALMRATDKGDLDLVKLLLLDYGADKTLRDMDGKAALDYAVFPEHRYRTDKAKNIIRRRYETIRELLKY